MNKYYVSKYASTKGLLTVEGEPGDGCVVNEDQITVGDKVYKLGVGCFATLDEARVDCINRTRKKISLLVKKEAKLENAIVGWESELSPVTNNYLTLTSYFLRMFASALGNNGCNDFSLEGFLTHEEQVAFVTEAHRLNGDPENLESSVKRLPYCQDFVVCGTLGLILGGK